MGIANHSKFGSSTLRKGFPCKEKLTRDKMCQHENYIKCGIIPIIGLQILSKAFFGYQSKNSTASPK
jgi:hypothetical protein